MQTRLVTAIDLGSYTLSAVTAEINENNKITILSSASIDSKGMKKGRVIDIIQLSECIKQLIGELEKKINNQIGELYITISGGFIKTMTSCGTVTLSAKENPTVITKSHIQEVIDDVLETTKKQKGMDDYDIIHTIPKYFIVDDDSKNKLKYPELFTGFKLTSEVVMVFAEKRILQNIEKCFEVAGYTIDAFVVASYASSLSVLSEEERDLGCIMIDIGGGISDCIVYNKGDIGAMITIPSGSIQITTDLYTILKTPPKNANIIKHRFCEIDYENCDWQQACEYKTFDENTKHTIELKVIRDVIESRIKDTLNKCYDELVKTYKPETIFAGLILTGGACNLDLYKRYAKKVFNLPVKIGKPITHDIGGEIDKISSLEQATVLGALRFAVSKTNFNIQPYIKKTNIIDIYNKIKTYVVEFYKDLIGERDV